MGFGRVGAMINIWVVLALIAAGASSILGCSSLDRDDRTDHSELIIGVAASLHPVLIQLEPLLNEATGTDIVFVAGASGTISHQITQGAPFDVFLSADRATVSRLSELNLLDDDQIIEFARGSLAAVSTFNPLLNADLVSLPNDPRATRIAIANPDVAPYGKAAKDLLMAHDNWVSVEKRVVYSGNVLQALEFARTGNVDVAYVSRSVIVNNNHEGLWTIQSFGATETIGPVQVAAVINRSAKRDIARHFIDALQSEKARDVLAVYGYAPVTGEDY